MCSSTISRFANLTRSGCLLPQDVVCPSAGSITGTILAMYFFAHRVASCLVAIRCGGRGRTTIGLGLRPACQLRQFRAFGDWLTTVPWAVRFSEWWRPSRHQARSTKRLLRGLALFLVLRFPTHSRLKPDDAARRLRRIRHGYALSAFSVGSSASRTSNSATSSELATWA